MALTSINVQPAKAGAEQHDRRTKHLDYVRQDLSSRNQIWESPDFGSVSKAIAEAGRVVKEKTGRSMQAKATPIREGVAVISDDTSMEQLQEFCSRCQAKWGIKSLAIYTHLDEGHETDGVWKANRHAHIIWQWYSDETGKSIRLSRDDMSEMQTMLAECLQMERGKESTKKHLDALGYKVKEMEQRRRGLSAQVNRLQKMVDGLESKLREREEKNRQYRTKAALIKTEIKALGLFKAISEGILHIVHQSRADKEIIALRAKNEQLGQDLVKSAGTIIELQQANKRVRQETQTEVAGKIYAVLCKFQSNPHLESALGEIQELDRKYGLMLNDWDSMRKELRALKEGNDYSRGYRK